MTWQNLRIALRSLFRAPAFALTVIFTIALAAGMATAVFSVVNAALLRPLEYKDPARLAMIWSAERDDARGPVSYDDFQDWRRDSTTLESGALYSSYYKPILSGFGQAERLSALLVSHEYFKVMSVQPKLGRFFRPEEDRDGRDDVVVLSYDLWRSRFHADPGVVGRSILLNARPHIIVGVAGPDLLPLPLSLAEVPAQIYRPIGEPFGPGSRDGRHLSTLVRLRRGVSLEQAQADLNVRSKQMEREHPDVDRHLAARIVSLRGDMTRNIGAALWSLQGAVLVLMLIACANVANLLLAKSSGRQREIAVREALGASPFDLVRMLLAESVVLGLLGGLGGLLLALWATAGMSAIAARILPDAGVITMDPRVLAFSLALSLASSFLFGLAPAVRLRTGHPDDALKSGGRVAGGQRNVLRQTLAAAQIALALVLVVATGLLGESFLRLRGFDPGFDPRGVLAASVALPSARYSTEASAVQFFDRVLTSLRTLPGARDAAIVSVVPMSGDFDRTYLQIEGDPAKPLDRINPDRYIVSPGYFSTVRVPLRAGRSFTERDDALHPPVCVISEAAARLWFPGQSPIGKKVRAGSVNGEYAKSPYREVVGVVGDVAQYGLGLPPTPQIYMPHKQFANLYLTLLVRTDGNASALASSVRKAVFAIDSEQPVYDVKPLEEIVSGTLTGRRLGLWLLIAFALTALALGSVGIYSVVSYSVSLRTSEFGIRMALGARPVDVIFEAARTLLPMVGIGLACGIGGALATARLIAGFLYGVSTVDTTAFGLLPLFLAAVALAACFLPARRAAHIDPVAALRSE